MLMITTTTTTTSTTKTKRNILSIFIRRFHHIHQRMPSTTKSKYLEKVQNQNIKCRRYGVRGTISALIQSILNFAPWNSFLWVALSLVVICIVGKFLILAISRIIGYICLAVYEVAKFINRIIHNNVVNDVAKVGTTFVCTLEHNKKCLRYVANNSENVIPLIDLDQFRTLMQLSHGQCNDFETAWKVFKYILLLLIGSDNVCKRLEWYKSISLTRIFVYYPASSFLWMDSKDNCDISIATNVCAFAGMELIFDFILTECILPFVIVVGCWPLVKNTFRLVTCEILLLSFEVRYLMFKLHPSKYFSNKSTFWSHRHQVFAADDDGVNANDDDVKSGFKTS